MINAVIKTVVLASTLLFSINGHAAPFLIDNFTDAQSITDDGTAGGSSSGPLPLSASASHLSGVQRTLFAEATGGDYGSESIRIGEPDGPGTGGVLDISNSMRSAGTATITWSNFGNVNLSTVANAIWLDVIDIDLNVAVELIVNGDSKSGPQFFAAGPGQRFMYFKDFTDPTAFQAVNLLQLQFTGPNAWDGQFRLLAADTRTVPEPAMWALLSLGVLAFRFGKTRTV